MAYHAAVAVDPVKQHKHCDRPKFTACLTDRAKVDDVIRGIPVVVGYLVQSLRGSPCEKNVREVSLHFHELDHVA